MRVMAWIPPTTSASYSMSSERKYHFQPWTAIDLIYIEDVLIFHFENDHLNLQNILLSGKADDIWTAFVESLVNV